MDAAPETPWTSLHGAPGTLLSDSAPLLAGAAVRCLGASGPWLAVMSPGSSASSSAPQVHLVPASAVRCEAPTPIDAAALPSTVEHAGIDARVDRAYRGWRASLRSAVAGGDGASTERLLNTLSQAAEWRRAKAALEGEAPAVEAPRGTAARAAEAGVASGGGSSSSSGSVNSSSSSRIISTVCESLLDLVEAGGSRAEAGSRAVTCPRTPTDQLASEANTSAGELLRLHAEVRARRAGLEACAGVRA
jgi:hypothetical protein